MTASSAPLARFPAPVYALLRIVAGLMYAQHGAQKLFGALGATPAGQPLYVVAGVIEFFGGLLIALGLFAGIVAFVASGEMAVAYFMVHLPQSVWPILNKGELAVLNCFVFLYVATQGSGIWSLDALRGASTRTPSPARP
jgi:putative oxidoreductase